MQKLDNESRAICYSARHGEQIDTRESLFSRVITVFIVPSKLDVGSVMEPELQRECCGSAAFPGLFHPLCLYVSLPRSLTEPRREFTGTAGRQAGPCHTAEQHRNVLYALERQDSWGEIVRQVSQTRSAAVETRFIRNAVKRRFRETIGSRLYAPRRVKTVSFCAVKQESHTRTHK